MSGGGDDWASQAVEAIRLARLYLRQQADLGVTDLPRAAQSPGTVDPEPSGGEDSMPQSSPKSEQLRAFHRSIRDCQQCGLCQERQVVVFGAGNADADVMFVGEAPGREEDRQGLPFVGPAGELLTRMIESIRFSRDEVYIANVIKCRPPANRDPKPDEIASCEPYLIRQIETIQPSVICALGRFAAQVLLKTSEPMGQLRGRMGHYQGIKVVPTYHPAALLRNPQWKRRAWEDLKRLRREHDGLDL